jgi:hypothetical protein
MRNAMIGRSYLLSTFAATMIGLTSFGPATAKAAEADAGASADIQIAQALCNTLGPYATIRRANEVANYFRGIGCWVNTPYHNGDGYYISGCC